MEREPARDARRREERREREVHALLGGDLRDDRHDARGRREEEQCAGRRERSERAAEDADRGGGDEHAHDRELGQRAGERPHRLPVVDEAQRVRPDGEREVVQQHAGLRVERLERREAEPEPHRLPARAGRHDRSERKPAREERGVERAVRAQRGREAARHERAIVEQDDEREARRVLLAEDGEERGERGRRRPRRAAPLRREDALGRRERGEREECDQELAPRARVDDRLAEERMERPERRGGERHGSGGAAEPAAERTAGERAAQDAEQEARRQRVERDLHGVVARHVAAGERVRDREREARDRPAREARLDVIGRPEDARRPQALEVRVLDDARHVVEDERRLETSGVRRRDQPGERESLQEERQAERA